MSCVQPANLTAFSYILFSQTWGNMVDNGCFVKSIGGQRYSLILFFLPLAISVKLPFFCQQSTFPLFQITQRIRTPPQYILQFTGTVHSFSPCISFRVGFISSSIISVRLSFKSGTTGQMEVFYRNNVCTRRFYDPDVSFKQTSRTWFCFTLSNYCRQLITFSCTL